MRRPNFELLADPEGWMPVASGQAELKLSESASTGASVLRMNFDFKGGGGFVVARKEISQSMPEAYVIRFKLRGQGPVNHLELKLVDPTGKNVWRYQHKDFHLPATWQTVQITSQEVEFAWGPAGGGAITKLGAVEVAIVAGEGGSGSVWISNFSLEDVSFSQSPAVQVSTTLPGHDKAFALDDDPSTCWKSAADDERPWISLDSLAPRVLGGLVVTWAHQAPLSGFNVKGSANGRQWKTLYATDHAGGHRSYVFLPNTTTRHLRLELNEPAGVAAMQVQSFEFSRSIEAFFHAVAKHEPRGTYPRWLYREQSLWTPAGAPLGKTCALINEQGMVEIDEGSFSIEPFISVNGRFFTWTDVAVSQELLDGWQPVPSVVWRQKDWRLQVTLVAGSTTRQVRYRFENLRKSPLKVKLFVALRPFQVTPPWQHFRHVGGVSAIEDLVWSDGAVRVNNRHTVKTLTEDARFGAMSFAEGQIATVLEEGRLPDAMQVHDSFGYASGALMFEASVAPGIAMETGMELVLSEGINEPVAWESLLPVAQIQATGWGAEVVRAQLTATAHILLTQSGPALQPGPRRYTRSWIRDGTIMSAALLRMGRAREVREFIEWYAPHQRADGFVPCCVDRDGVDWLVEHDSHGQLVSLIMDYYRFTGDMTFLRRMWPNVSKAVNCIAGLLGDDGLLPISVSHEGYLAQPVHSFWDDFWALRGLRDAVSMAQLLDDTQGATQWQSLADRFAKPLFAAIESTRKQHSLDYIPASVEWADFDPTGTANAITLLDLPPELDRQAVDWTFNKYLEDWRKKRTGELPWTNYTAYEIRIIGAFVRLGRRDAALELLRFFLSDRRPLAWNQWPEISWLDPESPGHVGDVPHTWIAAEYVLAVRSLFAFESESRQALVLAAGIAPEWLHGEGVTVKALRTLYGPLSYQLAQEPNGSLRFQIAEGITVPPGGLILRPPLPGPMQRVTVDGKPQPPGNEGDVIVAKVPALIVFETSMIAST